LTRHKQSEAARTHIRVSSETKKLLQDLQAKHGFNTIDKVLKHYLPYDLSNDDLLVLAAKELRDHLSFRPELPKEIESMRHLSKTIELQKLVNDMRDLQAQRRRLLEQEKELFEQEKELDRRTEVFLPDSK
jgi:hypothetical protein